MKTISATILAVIIMGTAYTQTSLKQVKQRVGNEDILKNWNVGETKYMHDATILRVEGENDIDHRTNVFYTSKKAILKLIDEKATTENFTAEQKAEMVETFLKDAPGGQVSLFYDRNDRRIADPSSFTILVKDSDNEDIFRKSLVSENDNPYYYKWGIWYNFKTINVPVEVGEMFTIVIKDTGLNRTFEFLVSIQLDEERPMPQNILSAIDSYLPTN